MLIKEVVPDKIVEQKFVYSKSKKIMFFSSYPISPSIIDNIITNKTFNYSKMTDLILLCSFLDIDKQLINSLSALNRDLGDNNIILNVRVTKDKIPENIYFFSKLGPLFLIINKESFESSICFKKSINLDLKKQIRSIIQKSCPLTDYYGEHCYLYKYKLLFQIHRRYLGDDQKNAILYALNEWDHSDYYNPKSITDIVEYALRHHVVLKLKGTDPNWFENLILSKLSQSQQTRINDLFKQNPYRYTKYDEHKYPVEYLTFGELKDVLVNKANRKYFGAFNDGNNICYLKFIGDIIKARNPSSHTRTPGLDVDLTSDTIIKSLIVLEWLNTIDSELLNLEYLMNGHDTKLDS